MPELSVEDTVVFAPLLFQRFLVEPGAEYR